MAFRLVFKMRFPEMELKITRKKNSLRKNVDITLNRATLLLLSLHQAVGFLPGKLKAQPHRRLLLATEHINFGLAQQASCLAPS